MSEDEREREEHQSCPTSVALSLSLSLSLAYAVSLYRVPTLYSTAFRRSIILGPFFSLVCFCPLHYCSFLSLSLRWPLTSFQLMKQAA